tara:strand:+ start:242 stop:1051 length:810 start_codon:yes stop_codon:yes gene_type:complete
MANMSKELRQELSGSRSEHKQAQTVAGVNVVDTKTLGHADTKTLGHADTKTLGDTDTRRVLLPADTKTDTKTMRNAGVQSLSTPSSTGPPPRSAPVARRTRARLGSLPPPGEAQTAEDPSARRQCAPTAAPKHRVSYEAVSYEAVSYAAVVASPAVSYAAVVASPAVSTRSYAAAVRTAHRPERAQRLDKSTDVEAARRRALRADREAKARVGGAAELERRKALTAERWAEPAHGGRRRSGGLNGLGSPLTSTFASRERERLARVQRRL